MKKVSLSIHKTFLNEQSTLIQKTKKTINVIKPGSSKFIVTKQVARQKTDRGNQLLALSYYKKCLKSSSIKNNRLDLVLFNLKFSKSLSESRHLISQRLVKVNGVIITNVNFVLNDFTIITCDNKYSPLNYITHEISNTVITPPNIFRINEKEAVFYSNTESKNILLPISLNIALMRKI